MGVLERQEAARRELEALQRARDAMASEVELLQEQRVSERQRLLQCRRQRDRMEEKLRLCSEVVAQTVSSVDRLHDLGEEELAEPTEALLTAQSDVAAAGVAVVRTLNSLAEDEASCKENSPSPAKDRKGSKTIAVPTPQGRRSLPPLPAVEEEEPVQAGLQARPPQQLATGRQPLQQI